MSQPRASSHPIARSRPLWRLYSAIGWSTRPNRSYTTVLTARRRCCAATPGTCSRSTPWALWSSNGGRGPLSVGQAAAEAAGEAGRRPAMPVVQRERLKSHDGARSTAGVLPSRAAAKGAPSNVYRRSARCLRALAATPKPARALGPSRIALTGASPSVSCRASSVYVPLMWGSLSPGCAPEVALQCRAWSM